MAGVVASWRGAVGEGEHLGGQGVNGGGEVVEREFSAEQGRCGGFGEFGSDTVAEPRAGGRGLQQGRVGEVLSAAGGQGELSVPLGEQPSRAGQFMQFGEANDVVLGARHHARQIPVVALGGLDDQSPRQVAGLGQRHPVAYRLQ
ncbi:hypothetical protein ACWD5V_28105 [Streptomyces sp. NPDC002523]